MAGIGWLRDGVAFWSLGSAADGRGGFFRTLGSAPGMRCSPLADALPQPQHANQNKHNKHNKHHVLLTATRTSDHTSLT